MRKLRAPLVGVLCLGVAVAIAVVVLGQGGVRPAAAQPEPIPHYKCYDIVGPPPAVAPVELVTQFGVESEVPVGPPAKLCLPAGKNGEPIPPAEWPHLKCYNIEGQDPTARVNLETQFGIQKNVSVGQASLLCIPATKTLLPDPPGSQPPPDRHWECFDIAGPPPQFPPVELLTQFGLEVGVEVGSPSKLCAPALKNGLGDLELFTHLECYNIAGAPPAVPPVNLTTQFGIEEGVPVGPPTMLCAPALKQHGVGGVAELPALDGSAAATTDGGDGFSTGAYVAMAGIAAGAALVLSAGVLYARRRWLK